MTRSAELDAMTEDDKVEDLLAAIDEHSAVRMDNRSQMAFWGGAVDRLQKEGLVHVRDTGSDEAQYTCYEITRKTPDEIAKETQDLLETECDHGVVFPDDAADLPADEIRRKYPRLNGPCPKGCGFVGIAYASKLHYYAGDW